jgi:hypothetical protein
MGSSVAHVVRGDGHATWASRRGGVLYAKYRHGRRRHRSFCNATEKEEGLGHEGWAEARRVMHVHDIFP